MNKLDKDPFQSNEKGTNFASRLKYLIGNKSGRAFSKEVNISYSTLHNYLTSVSLPTLDNLIALAKHTGASIEWLALGEGNIESNSYEKESKINDDTYVAVNDCRDIAIYSDFKGFDDEYYRYHSAKVEKAWLNTRHLKAEDCAIFLVSGDSMHPTLRDGEEIIVDRSKNILKDGKIFVLNNNGAILVKKVQVTFTGITLISDNSDYTPIRLDLHEIGKLIIIGQVVRSYRDF